MTPGSQNVTAVLSSNQDPEFKYGTVQGSHKAGVSTEEFRHGDKGSSRACSQFRSRRNRHLQGMDPLPILKDRLLNLIQKYTVQSTGIWERIRRAFAVDPNRSNGIPLNPQFRNPSPGAIPPEDYDDPVSFPAADIAENPYFKRDMRRRYPRLSVVNQADVVGLLSVGSKASPREDVLQIGEAGAKQLVQVKQEGEERGLAALFERDRKTVGSVLGPSGMPPLPTALGPKKEARQYVMDRDRVEGYPEEYVTVFPSCITFGTDALDRYPCRTFV